LAKQKKLFHILSSQQFDRSWLEKTLFPEILKLQKVVRAGKVLNVLKGKSVCLLFYEPSTRTRTSFEQAVIKLGGIPVTTENAKEFSSAIKGETMFDTTRIINAYYFSAIVIRSDYEGASSEAASVSKVPVINAGDGAGQHPTQALLDLFTIYENFKKIDGIRVAMVGDLKYGRTVRSLSYLLAKFKKVHIEFVAPQSLQMKADILDHLKENGVTYNKSSDLAKVAPMVDVIYMTRAQKERMTEGESVKGEGVSMTREILNTVNKKSIVLHPLPRSNDFNELPEELTDDPRIKIFEQAENGLFTRMALLKMVIK
jgi:aspartate carbamoyltransferase catalytic subunit